MMQRLAGEMWGDLRGSSTERRVLIAITLAGAIVAAALADVDHPMVLAALLGAAVVAAMHPASNAGLFVIAIVLARWLSATDDPTTPDAALLAVVLVAFHLSVALMASLPHAVTLPPRLRARWTRRFTGLAAVAVATWCLVALFSERDAGPSTALATVALLVLAGGAAAVRLSLSRPTR